MTKFCIACVLLLTFDVSLAEESGQLSAEENGQSTVDFERQIRPLLIERCGQCHGPDQQKGGLRLDARHTAMKGGDGGPVLVPGNAQDSELLHRISSEDMDIRMPPRGSALTNAEVALFRSWIDAGAPWTETDYDRAAARDPRKDHWAWQPLTAVDPPEISPTVLADLPDGWSSSALSKIDRFIIADLLKNGLRPLPAADRRTLIRRLTFDLHGLPPTPEAIAAFVQDTSDNAVADLVDQLLASPHYGERWAQHWLDVAHYADTHGFERDQRRDSAWRYRDWVIEALNHDMPFDQFLQDQIAGDVLRPDDPNAVAATGFLAAGPWDFVGQQETPSPVLKRLARSDDLDDIVTQVMTAGCGITINCARCHDHKLDPVSQQEYYSLWAVFAGVKRAERVLSTSEERQLTDRRSQLQNSLQQLQTELTQLQGPAWNLADIVGGGDGTGSGQAGAGIDPASGNVITDRRGYLESAAVNVFHPCPLPFVDGVVIPNGRAADERRGQREADRSAAAGSVPVTSTGLRAAEVPETSGQAWDSIRNGPVHSQFSTTLSGIDFATPEHSLLSLHANVAITFDLQAMRIAGMPEQVNLVSQVGYFGQTARSGATFTVFGDGQRLAEFVGLGRDDGLQNLNLAIAPSIRFLTLMATDHGNGIGHDQICLADPVLRSNAQQPTAEDLQKITQLQQRIQQLTVERDGLPEPARIYAVTTETPPAVHVLLRGDPEQTGPVVEPGSVACLPLESAFGDNTLTDAERRIALAHWMTSPQNPLTARVIVNRLWHHHFGTGIVATPSDFGAGGARPSHPELLDWLALQLQRNQWSLKSVHRLICLSSVYRQVSHVTADDEAQWQQLQHNMGTDADNQLLWRQNARRLDAESLRDAVLVTSGKLNDQMFGPGYRDFEYREEYAPVYTYVTADAPELWRRSIYRFVVRTTPDPFLTTLDCPDAANLTPVRNRTTTALQSLALLNDEFMLKQSGYFAERVRQLAVQNVVGEATTTETVVGDVNTTVGAAQVRTAFVLAFGRQPSVEELSVSVDYLERAGLREFCHMLLNASEFVYID